jgi:hypothetical protein
MSYQRRTIYSAADQKGPVPIPHVMLHGVEHKSCSGCGSLRPLNQFEIDTRKGDGRRSECRGCRRR